MEHILPGGNVAATVVRVGDTVRKPVTPGDARHHGRDERGRTSTPGTPRSDSARDRHMVRSPLPVGDVHGHRRVVLTGLAVFGASLSCGLTQGIDLLVAARFVQGAGAALLLP